MKGNSMERDIYDSLRLTATTCEKIADVLNAIAECLEKVTACLMDLIEEIKRQPLKMILQKLRPDYKDKCKIRWLDINRHTRIKPGTVSHIQFIHLTWWTVTGNNKLFSGLI